MVEQWGPRGRGSPSVEAEIIRKLVIYSVDILLFEVIDPSFACSLVSECFMEMKFSVDCINKELGRKGSFIVTNAKL